MKKNPLARVSLQALALLCLVAFLAVPAGAQDMTVDDVVAKNIEAKGGQEAWDAIESAKISGKLEMPGGAMTMPMTLYFKRPDKVRVEMEMQGQKIVQAYDGETGWQIMPLMGKAEPQKMSEAEVKQVKRQADFEGPLVDWKEKGHTVELVGKTEVDGTPAWQLDVTLESGEKTTMYLDADHFVEFKTVGTAETPGGTLEIEAILGDYKEVGGVMLAHSLEMRTAGQPQGATITFDNVTVNPEGVDDSLFTMPEVAAPAEAADGN